MANRITQEEFAITAPEPLEYPEALARPTTPMDLLQLAIEKAGSIDVIERLAALQREERDYHAKVEFDQAMGRCQSAMVRISADAVNPQTRSRYATYGKLDSILRPIYSKEGFSLSFSTEECPMADMIRVTCLVSHSGYERKYQLDMPADGKGAKGGDVMTKTHATGAAATYGMRYLLKMIFNVAIGEDDTDGNPPGQQMEESSQLEWIDALQNAPDMDGLKRVFSECWEQAKRLNDHASKQKFQSIYEGRKRVLLAGAK